MEMRARDREVDVARRNQMHLDPRQDVVPARLVTKSIDGDVAIELAIDPFEQVQIERGGDAFRVVVGGDQPVDRLDPVHADQKPRTDTEELAEIAQQIGRRARHEIADGRARKESELGQIRDLGRQVERPGEVGGHRDDV